MVFGTCKWFRVQISILSRWVNFENSGDETLPPISGDETRFNSFRFARGKRKWKVETRQEKRGGEGGDWPFSAMEKESFRR